MKWGLRIKRRFFSSSTIRWKHYIVKGCTTGTSTRGAYSMSGSRISWSCRAGTWPNSWSRRTHWLTARSLLSWQRSTSPNCGMYSEYFGHSRTSTTFMRISSSTDRSKRSSTRLILRVSLQETFRRTIPSFRGGPTTRVIAWVSGKIQTVRNGLSRSLCWKSPDA